MNSYSPLALAVIAQALDDVRRSNGVRRDALKFLKDEDRLFFFIDLGQLDIQVRKMLKHIEDKKLNKQWSIKLKRAMRAAL